VLFLYLRTRREPTNSETGICQILFRLTRWTGCGPSGNCCAFFGYGQAFRKSNCRSRSVAATRRSVDSSRTGDFPRGRAIYEELVARSKAAYVPAYDVALVCVGMGWTDQSFDWLGRALDERSGWLTYLNVEPRLDTVRSDPRFNELLRRVRLRP
jgi:hypothetical protein